MELEHHFTVAAPVERAWEVLLDLERVAPCMPGATLTSHEGDAFTGNVRVKLGPVTMTYAGQGRFLERDPAARRIVIEASGKDRRGGGTARATITAALAPDGGSTAVAVHSDLVVTGRAAQFGRGMIADVSTRLLGQFTDCLSGALGEAPAATPAGAPPEPEPEPAATPARPPAAAVTDTPTVPTPTRTVGTGTIPTGTVPTRTAEPIDLLGVTGVRAATGRLLPYLLVFLIGGLVGGALVALLVR